jgi:hypothetical protein
MGKNSALDAAVGCMTTSFPVLLGADIVPAMLASFGKALADLRAVMANPVKAYEIETVCAIYLVMITQVRLEYSSCLSLHHNNVLDGYISTKPITSIIPLPRTYGNVF